MMTLVPLQSRFITGPVSCRLRHDRLTVVGDDIFINRRDQLEGKLMVRGGARAVGRRGPFPAVGGATGRHSLITMYMASNEGKHWSPATIATFIPWPLFAPLCQRFEKLLGVPEERLRNAPCFVKMCNCPWKNWRLLGEILVPVWINN